MSSTATFYKIPFDIFLKDSRECGFIDTDTPEEIVKIIWGRARLPEFRTTHRPQYRLLLPFPVCVQAGSTFIMPTGVYPEILDGWVMHYYPAQGLTLLEHNSNGHVLLKMKAKENHSYQEGEVFAYAGYEPKEDENWLKRSPDD